MFWDGRHPLKSHLVQRLLEFWRSWGKTSSDPHPSHSLITDSRDSRATPKADNSHIVMRICQQQLCQRESAVPAFGMWCVNNQPAPQSGTTSPASELLGSIPLRGKEWLEVYEQWLFFGRKKTQKNEAERVVYSFIGENRRLKVKLENCIKGRSRAGSTQLPVSTGDEAALGFCSNRENLSCAAPGRGDLLGCRVENILPAFAGPLWVADRFFPLSFLLSSPFRSGSYFVITSDGFANDRI